MLLWGLDWLKGSDIMPGPKTIGIRTRVQSTDGRQEEDAIDKGGPPSFELNEHLNRGSI